MDNTGLIITLAYPDTVVMVSDEWFCPYLRFIGVGKKDYVRAGHAALVLIDKETGVLEYHDFGRYVAPTSTGRVRGSDTDNELHFPLKAEIEKDKITNLESILEFLGTQPKLTHGDGKLVASVCDAINYHKARTYITKLQNKYFIKYAAFAKGASNCTRFVTDSLIASVTDLKIKKKLENSYWFTPSSVGAAVIADTENNLYEVSENGIISKFLGSQKSENMRCFLDKLKDHEVNLFGRLEPKHVGGLHQKAQWLSGIGTGAWFELHDLGSKTEYRFRRISPYGNVDCDGIFYLDNDSFDYDLEFEFLHDSNCKFFNVQQGDKIFRFERNDE